MNKKVDMPDQKVSGICVRDITGIKDEHSIKAILTTGATRGEIVQACEYCFESHHIKPGHIRPVDERIRHIIDILDYSCDLLD